MPKFLRIEACPKFLRQTFHEWAGDSIACCDWVRAYYQQQPEKSKSHHAALRAKTMKADWTQLRRSGARGFVHHVHSNALSGAVLNE